MLSYNGALRGSCSATVATLQRRSASDKGSCHRIFTLDFPKQMTVIGVKTRSSSNPGVVAFMEAIYDTTRHPDATRSQRGLRYVIDRGWNLSDSYPCGSSPSLYQLYRASGVEKCLFQYLMKVVVNECMTAGERRGIWNAMKLTGSGFTGQGHWCVVLQSSDIWLMLI